LILVIFLNLIAVGLAVVLPNDFLMWHSYTLYGVQIFTILPYLSRKARFSKNLFLPTFFVAIYYLVNLFLGSYLIPRDYGWNKEYTSVLLRIENYNIIVPFLLLSNLILFILSIQSFHDLNKATFFMPSEKRLRDKSLSHYRQLIVSFLYCIIFFAVSYFDVYSAFSFQLAILILHTSTLSRQKNKFRYLIYVFYVVILLGFSYENKREIAMALFLLVFFEAYYRRHTLRMTFKNIVRYVSIVLFFFCLVLTASILRGYGFEATSVISAVKYLPDYIVSDIVVDMLVDNFEINYSYGSSVTSIDMVIEEDIKYQYGASLLKILFLPLPREIFPGKPKSVMQLYTQVYRPDLWSIDGSLPVIFASEMFINFHYFGLLIYGFVFYILNKLFLTFHLTPPYCFKSYSAIFLFMTILMFARGSGIEQWLLYYLLAVPILVMPMLFTKCMKSISNSKPIMSLVQT